MTARRDGQSSGRTPGKTVGQLAIVLGVCALVYWLKLDARPFDFSEGHRVVPGWTMLESGDYWHVRMFGLGYFRKPPGMPWAIALSSDVFGKTTFGARAPSAFAATLMTLIAWLYARRWFSQRTGEEVGLGDQAGRPEGLFSPALSVALAQALMPLMWSPGRSAEIEMLNNLGTQLLAFGALDLLVMRRARSIDGAPGPSLSPAWALLSSAAVVTGVVIAALAKGPASASVLVGVVLAPCLIARSARPLRSLWFWSALLASAAVLVPLGLHLHRMNTGADVVREDIASQFLWSRERIVGVLTLLPGAFLSALPASAAMLFLIGHASREEAQRDPVMFRARSIALACALSWLVAVGVLVLAGISNPRYAMPASVLLPPVLGYVVLGLRRSDPEANAGFGKERASLARRTFLGVPLAWSIVLLCASVSATLVLAGPRRGDADAGVSAAMLFADAVRSEPLPVGSSGSPADPAERVVWSDEVIESRPDVLLAMERASAPPVGVRIRAVWAKGALSRGEFAPVGAFMLLRTDSGGGEGQRYAGALLDGRLIRLTSAKVRTQEFALFRVAKERVSEH